MAPPLEVVVSGPYASFNRPELKVERVSYPLPTPSAARGILEAIFWKPEIRWRVCRIGVLKEVHYLPILRNEISARQSKTSATGFLNKEHGYYAEEDRAQRNALVLKGPEEEDIAYRIWAEIELREGVDRDVAAYRDQFRRRVKRGACFHRPYLGTREFAADFREPVEEDVPLESLSMDLGRMLFDLKYAPRGVSASPVFFDARLENGVLEVPQELYEEVMT